MQSVRDDDERLESFARAMIVRNHLECYDPKLYTSIYVIIIVMRIYSIDN